MVRFFYNSETCRKLSPIEIGKKATTTREADFSPKCNSPKP